MDKVRLVAIALLLWACISCGEHSPDALIGDWRADLVVEEGDTLEMDLANVTLRFTEDRYFKYKHTQRDSLSGSFNLSKGLIKLFVNEPVTDTIIIQISNLNDESMILRMNHEGNERLVTLVK
ncbi:MAG: hypothetical protein IPL46_32825 [Saprospiraceae bacterium]|nr:hypothetical protein [Saprospiraceae bacterium]